MLPKRGFLIYIPSLVLLSGLAILLFRSPAQYPALVFLLTVFVMAMGAYVALEPAILFAVFVTILEIASLAVIKGHDRWYVMGQPAVMWASLAVLRRFTDRERADEQLCGEGLRLRQQGTLNLQKERDAMSRKLSELEAQEAVRQQLSNAVYQFSSLLDPVLVRQRLMEFVRAAIGRGTIHFFAGNVPRDPMDRWVMERRLSLLVTDVQLDARFKPVRAGNEVRSVLAAPVIVERQLIGIIRLNGFEPNMFSVGDLRVLESLTLLACLALENLSLLAKLREGAVRDNLTGLYTHRFLQERLADEILRAGRYGTEFGLLLMDIDHFKRYNDTYGHAAGDQVLVRVAQVLQQYARDVDLVARYGGEEFVLLMPNAGIVHARESAERIRQAIQAEHFNFGPEDTMQEKVTISIGLSAFPAEATTPSQMIRIADSRLYEAKDAGRNRVVG